MSCKESLASGAIGVFDSGVGGLTVLSALKKQLPDEDLIYLGDTARVPYGTKSPESVIRYALQAARLLIERQIKLLVVACNTASAVAIDVLSSEFSPVPVVGVVLPGANASCLSSLSGKIAVIATEGTVQGGAYQRAIHQIRPDASVVAKPCSLFVALAEEGWVEGALVEKIIENYLSDLFSGEGEGVDTLVLGCTHFPALSEAIQNVVGPKITLIDSAQTTSKTVASILLSNQLVRVNTGAQRSIKYLVTDGPDRFARVAGIFLGEGIEVDQVELVDLS